MHKAVAKVIDFGLSRRLSTGTLGGTKQWRSPEQLLNPQMLPSKSVDVFACSSIVYFLQAQHPPMLNVSVQDLASSARPVCPTPTLNFLTSRAQDATMACLTFDEKQRPCDLSNLQEALEEAVCDFDNGTCVLLGRARAWFDASTAGLTIIRCSEEFQLLCGSAAVGSFFCRLGVWWRRSSRKNTSTTKLDTFKC